MLNIKNLNIFYNGNSLVNNISFDIHTSKTTCIIGESGSGKTLTALAIMDLLPKAIKMSAEFNFIDKNKYVIGKDISMIFQEPLTSLNPVITIGKQMEEVFILHTNLSGQQRKKEVLRLLDKVCLPSPESIINAYPAQLSGGQRQRVMIAMALSLKPKLIIADEPTTALDITTQSEILKLLKDIQQEMGMAILFITHDFSVVENIADEVLVMNKGNIVESGNINNVFKHPKNDYTKKLISATPKLNTAKRPAIKNQEVLLEVKNIQHDFTAHSNNIFSLFPKKNPVLKNISFKLHKGETIGIVGESGSSKSTLVRCILNLYTPKSGEVFYKNKNIQENISEFRKNIQMVFQDPFSSLNPRMTIGESIGEGLKAQNICSKLEVRKKVEELLEQCKLAKDSYFKYPHHFSGGQRQRICIARALALKPDIIIADEAVSALDVSIQKDILELLNDLKQIHNLSYLFISHDLRVVSQISDKVMVMHKGEIVENGTVNQVFCKPKHSYTKKLLAVY